MKDPLLRAMLERLSISDIPEMLDRMTGRQLEELDRLLSNAPIWGPQPGAQARAYYTPADMVLYGGAAGGGKSSLIIGKCLTQFHNSLVIRREGPELTSLIDEMLDVLGRGREVLNTRDKIIRLDDRIITFGSVPNPGDWKKYQGRPRQFLAIDEAVNVPENEVTHLRGWVRSASLRGNDRTQTLLATNPPSTIEGRWVIRWFRPWLDPKHPNRAMPGELRWFASIDGDAHYEVESSEPFFHKGERITPQSRTFIPAKLSDNAYLRGTAYMSQLQSLDEPLRSQLIYGDFSAGARDDAHQLIPTTWIEAAMDRKLPDEWRLGTPDSIGLDVSREGRGSEDESIISIRHGNCFLPLITVPKEDTESGYSLAGYTLRYWRAPATIFIDSAGVGASPYDALRQMVPDYVVGVNSSFSATRTDKSGMLRFSNMRSQMFWALREALSPDSATCIVLPRDTKLAEELAALRYKEVGKTVNVSGRDQLRKILGRSIDRAFAVALALQHRDVVETSPIVAQYNPYTNFRR